MKAKLAYFFIFNFSKPAYCTYLNEYCDKKQSGCETMLNYTKHAYYTFIFYKPKCKKKHV